MATERKFCVAWAVVLLGVAIAHTATAANVDDGVCALNVTITIASGSKAQLFAIASDTSPVYTLTVTGGNWNPVNSAACLYPAGAPAIGRSTTVTATPNTSDDTITCDVMIASGSWTQTFSGTLPPDEVGTYRLVGTWGAWVLVVTNLSSFVSVMPLTFQNPLDAASLPACAGSTGITSFALKGVQVFQNAIL
jgi:hypothetical protein